MKIDDAKNLKTGDCIWCVVDNANVFSGWADVGLPQEFIFLSLWNTGNPQTSLYVANKNNGETTSLETSRAETTREGAIHNAIEFMQLEINGYTNRRKRFEGMLEEGK